MEQAYGIYATKVPWSEAKDHRSTTTVAMTSKYDKTFIQKVVKNLQEPSAGGAHECTDRNIDVGWATLAAVKAALVRWLKGKLL